MTKAVSGEGLALPSAIGFCFWLQAGLLPEPGKKPVRLIVEEDTDIEVCCMFKRPVEELYFRQGKGQDPEIYYLTASGTYGFGLIAGTPADEQCGQDRYKQCSSH